MADKINKQFNWNVVIPAFEESIELDL